MLCQHHVFVRFVSQGLLDLIDIRQEFQLRSCPNSAVAVLKWVSCPGKPLCHIPDQHRQRLLTWDGCTPSEGSDGLFDVYAAIVFAHASARACHGAFCPYNSWTDLSAATTFYKPASFIVEHAVCDTMLQPCISMAPQSIVIHETRM